MDLLAAQDENGINRICFKSLICCFLFSQNLSGAARSPIVRKRWQGCELGYAGILC